MSVILTDHTSIPRSAPSSTPAWCDPRRCETSPDTADEFLVAHRTVVLDEQGPQGRWSSRS